MILGGLLPHPGSFSPPCPPRKEVLHLELCVLIPPRTVQTWIAGKRHRTGPPNPLPRPRGDIFGVTNGCSQLSITPLGQLPPSSGISEFFEYIFAPFWVLLFAGPSFWWTTHPKRVGSPKNFRMSM